ncbi:MAG: putative thiosulfate sulfurtransferase [Firmicutes bacterium]|nr:putative thiosulfate sulfurtransferase [candidate division NPL-UPA2 bacterium]
MKKLVVLVVALALVVGGLLPVGPQGTEASTIRILIDGQPMTLQVAPVIRNGRVLVPFRALFEAFGATVNWQEATETVTGQLGTTSISLRLNRPEAVVNGRAVRLDVAPIVLGGRTLVPLRFVAENLGADVRWEESTQTVVVVRQVALRRVRIAGNAQSDKLAAYANQDAFISPAELKQLMDRNEPDIVVIGVINPTLAIIPLHAARSPIAGSFTVWRADYSGTGSPLALAPAVSGMASSREVMENLLSRAGATPQSMIVVYALDNMHDAARFMWQIRQLGHRDVRLLDGGLNAWQAANFPTGSFARLSEQPVQAAYRSPDFNPAVNNVRLGDVVRALQNPNEWVVIDTRSADEFNGRPSASSRGAFGTGRLIGSVHIDWVAANAADRTLRTREEIVAAYSAAIRGRKVIVFCQSGVRSAHTQVVLRDVLGLEVYNFDGSWIEWSYAASEFSANQVPESVRRTVLQHTEQWTDNRGELR